MFKELVSLAIIAGFILNIVYVEHPNTASYTIAFVLSMAFFSPVALAWRYRFSSRQLRMTRDAVENAEEEVFVSVSEAVGLSKDVQSSADVEMGLVQTDGPAAVSLEGT
jgi:type III secretory pathway component EscR